MPAVSLSTMAPLPGTQNLLYTTYNGVGPSLALISSAFVLNIAGLPGLVFNTFLCLVTIRNSSLRGTSNQLLAFTALFELLHQSAHFSFMAVAITGINFIPYQLSVYLQLLSIFGVAAAQMAMLVTAVDRLFAVSTPILHNRIGSVRSYLAMLLLLCCLPGIYFVFLALHSLGTHWNKPVTGSIGDLFIDEMEQLFQYILLVGLLNIIAYLLVWIVVRSKSKTHNSSAPAGDRNARLFRSLVVIICVVLGGYLLNNLVRLFFIKIFALNDVQAWFCGTYSGAILNIGASAEVPILFIFSTDYRKLFNHEWKRLIGKKQGSIRLFTTQAQTNNAIPAEELSRRRSEARRITPIPDPM